MIITVESSKKETRCRKCGRTITKFPGYYNWLQRRYQCLDYADHATTTQRLELHERGSQFALDYEYRLLVQLMHNTIEDVRIKEGLSYDSVLGLLEWRIALSVTWTRFSQLGTLGMDEIASKKGLGQYLVIVTVRLAEGRLRILGVLPNREKNMVLDFLHSIPERLKGNVHTVCSDMYERFIAAVQAVLPAARLLMDRFHVARVYRER